MNTHADKTQENKNQSVANSVSQKQRGSESAYQFVDNRPEAIQMRKLQEMANNSPQVKRLGAFQEMANNSLQAIQAAQLQAKADNPQTVTEQSENTKPQSGNTKQPNNVIQRSLYIGGQKQDDIPFMINDYPVKNRVHNELADMIYDGERHSFQTWTEAIMAIDEETSGNIEATGLHDEQIELEPDVLYLIGETHILAEASLSWMEQNNNKRIITMHEGFDDSAIAPAIAPLESRHPKRAINMWMTTYRLKRAASENNFPTIMNLAVFGDDEFRGLQCLQETLAEGDHPQAMDASILPYLQEGTDKRSKKFIEAPILWLQKIIGALEKGADLCTRRSEKTSDDMPGLIDQGRVDKETPFFEQETTKRLNLNREKAVVDNIHKALMPGKAIVAAIGEDHLSPILKRLGGITIKSFVGWGKFWQAVNAEE